MSPVQAQRMQGQIAQLVLAQVRELIEAQQEEMKQSQGARFNLIDEEIQHIKTKVEEQIEIGRVQTGAVLSENLSRAERVVDVLANHIQKAESEVTAQKERIDGVIVSSSE